MMTTRIITSALLTLLVASPILAQRFDGPGRFGNDRFRQRARAGERFQQRAIDEIQRALNLTDDQSSRLKTLLDSRRAEAVAVRTEGRDRARALRDLRRQANPDPTQLGNAMLALRQVRERLQAINQRFRSSFESLLTPAQARSLESFERASPALRALRRFRPGPGLR